jgi:hypothetical protein
VFVDVWERLKDKFWDFVNEVNTEGERHERLARFLIDRKFIGRTLDGFKFEYRLVIVVKRVNDDEFTQAGMMRNEAHEALVTSFNEDKFLTWLDDGNYFFRLVGPRFDIKGLAEVRPSIHRVVVEDESESIAELTVSDVEKAFKEIHYVKNGCDVTLKIFEVLPLADHLIEENYVMLSEEQKQRIKSDNRYQNIDEALAVAVLKRRLEIEGAQYRQEHDSGYISIRTERLGRSFRISWEFKPGAPEGYSLLGFRKSGSGFYPDQFDETNNGELVVQDARSNQTIEDLPEGQTYFYTFMLKPWHASEGKQKYGVGRFQVTIATREERETIERTLRRIEEGATKESVDPAYKNLHRALEAAGLSFAFENALDEFQKSLTRQVKEKGLSPEEEEVKIDFIKEAVAGQREKYLS